MTKRREISPALNATADECFAMMPAPIKGIITTIRAEKDDGLRPVPSKSFVDRSSILTATKRAALLDFIADLVDENLTGRSDMCMQFAQLIELAFHQLNIQGRAVCGTAEYFSKGGDVIFEWRHAWVRVGPEVIDGNVDSLSENPMVPKEVAVDPYWGPIKGIPGRRLVEEGSLAEDLDVLNEWGPRLRGWLESDFRQID